jgi:hypothetical protein
MVTESPQQFVVVSDSEEERMLYARTLLRKFPAAVIVECRVDAAALMLERAADFTGVAVHFGSSPEIRAFVENLRQIARQLPIVSLSGFDRSIDALAAGTSRFLPADQWLMLGVVMQDLLANPPGARTARSPARGAIS